MHRQAPFASSFYVVVYPSEVKPCIDECNVKLRSDCGICSPNNIYFLFLASSGLRSGKVSEIITLTSKGIYSSAGTWCFTVFLNNMLSSILIACRDSLQFWRSLRWVMVACHQITSKNIWRILQYFNLARFLPSIKRGNVSVSSWCTSPILN